MIVNVSSSPSSSGETLRSLQFAEMAKSCEIVSSHQTSAAPPRPSLWRERNGGLGPRGGIPSEIGTPQRVLQNLETSAPPRSSSWRGRSVRRGRIPPREQNAETLKRKVKPDTNKDCLEILTGEKNTADLLKDVTRYSRRELEVACQGFNNIIGSSSDWIVVFKGNMKGGPEIAVISLNNQEEHWTSHHELYFEKEVANLARLNHENIGKLIGYCIEGVPFTRMLVFEYASNGTLSEHLHYEEGYQAALSWRSWMMIILGISKGLKYLHTEIEPPFTVYELNSSAVYLTDDFSPKAKDYLEDPEKMASVVDPALKQHFRVEDLEAICQVVRSCIHAMPGDKVSMQNLFETLESKLDTTVSSELKASSLAWVEHLSPHYHLDSSCNK